MGLTPNRGYIDIDRVDDKGMTFINFRDYIVGTGATANINKIDVDMQNAFDGVLDLAGGGRTTETIKGNADDIANVEGVGRTTETVKGNADDIATANSEIDGINLKIEDIKGYIGYTDGDIYGVEADFENNTFTRLSASIGKTVGLDFNSLNALGGRRRCNLADNGVVNAYYGDVGYVEDGSNGQVMVEQPKFYYKVVPLKLDKVVGGRGYHLRKARYYVCDTPKSGFKLHPAFIQDGKIKNFIYLSAFEASSYDSSASAYNINDSQDIDFSTDKIASIANAKPISGLTQNLTRANMRNIAHNRGTGWEQHTIQSASASQLLFMIEYASFNSQVAIGFGVSKTDDGSTNMAELTGATSTLGNVSGSMPNGSVSFRGEENFWMNIFTFTDGINMYNQSDVYISDNTFADDTGNSPYSLANITASKTNGYISAFGYDETDDWLFIPSETVGNSSLPVGDYFYQTATINIWRVVLLGGAWNSSSAGGAFCWSVTDSSAGRVRKIGGRSVYVPQD